MKRRKDSSKLNLFREYESLNLYYLIIIGRKYWGEGAGSP